MTLTLWRGETLLGELVERVPAADRPVRLSNKPPPFSAFLIPAADAAPEGVWQVAMPPELGFGVQQHPREPDIVAEREARSRSSSTYAAQHVELQPATPEEIAGVPREVQLTVRGADGTVHLPRQVLLQELRYEPALHEIALREVPREALIDGVAWQVSIDFVAGTGLMSQPDDPLDGAPT